jgi:hypothetical protein
MRTVLINNVSWGAVLAGVVISLVAQLLLNMLGIGIGAATIHPMGSGTPDAESFSLGAGIWWTVSGIIAAFCGGIVAGRLSGRPKESTTGWHGVTTWALSTLVVFWLLTTAIGSVIGGGLNVLGSVAGGLGKAVGQAAQSAAPMVANNPDPFSGIADQIRSRTGGTDPQQMRDAATQAVRAAVSGDPQQQQQAHDHAVQLLAQSENISQDQANQQLSQYEQQYRDAVARAKQEAAQAADTASRVVSRAALFGFVALVLGGIAAWFGGRMGAVDPTIRGYVDERGRATTRVRTPS